MDSASNSSSQSITKPSSPIQAATASPTTASPKAQTNSHDETMASLSASDLNPLSDPNNEPSSANYGKYHEEAPDDLSTFAPLDDPDDFELPSENSEDADAIVIYKPGNKGQPPKRITTLRPCGKPEDTTSHGDSREENVKKILEELNPFDIYNFVYKLLYTLSATNPEKRDELTMTPQFADKTILEAIASTLDEVGMECMIEYWDFIWSNIISPRITEEEAMEIAHIKRDYYKQQSKVLEQMRQKNKTDSQSTDISPSSDNDDVLYYDDPRTEWPLKVMPPFTEAKPRKKKRGKKKSKKSSESANEIEIPAGPDGKHAGKPSTVHETTAEEEVADSTASNLDSKSLVHDNFPDENRPEEIMQHNLMDSPNKLWEPTPDLDEIKQKSEERQRRFAEEIAVFQRNVRAEVVRIKAAGEAAQMKNMQQVEDSSDREGTDDQFEALSSISPSVLKVPDSQLEIHEYGIGLKGCGPRERKLRDQDA
ncbi:hypothetical protein Dda_2406 [Drechslerella dactyloides]|uniref:Uncharacterized protein n=1 Tax=Drechslerella dactyloides TaxID=74499 RepID=A0AAD6J3H1_DREDA|nr:hypothetical protein Dda_2406 [Drechslerella dactyloides]